MTFQLEGILVFDVEFGFDWLVAVGYTGGVGAPDNVFKGFREFDFLFLADFVIADDVDSGMWGD